MRSVSMLAVGLFVGVGLVWAPAANAGEWAQVTCTQPNGQPAPVEGWQGGAYGGYGPDSGPSNTCAQPGGALTAFDSSAAQEAAYTGPMWTYTAPAGSTIAGGSLTVSLSTPQGQAYVATPKNEYSAADVLVNCQFNEPCDTAARTVPIIHPGGTQLFMVAECVGPTEGATTCPAGSGGGVNAEISLHAADVELQNSSTPTGTGFAGSLLAPAASGKTSLTFSAQDPEGPGVYRVIVEVDGTAVYQGTPDSNGGKCASIGAYASGVSEFLSAQPCKRSVAVDVPVDTTRFSNGQHTLKVTMQDAAANPAVVYDGTISTANASAIGPSSPAVLRGAANGTNASDEATLTARWARTSKAAFTSRYGVRKRITGHLTTSAGEPISAASLDVFETPAYHGAGERRIGGISTGPTGQWSLTLPRNISSCVLRFVYRSHVNDTVAAATATLELSVRAGILLSVTPRSASVGRKIFFSGSLHGVPVPEGGKQVVLEARAGREWIQFKTIHTNAKGRYRASYRFKFSGPVTYRFRVVCPHETDFPFLEGASNIVTVHER
ncbi:MAG: hypothetical protein ACHQCH_04365 [Solirubrobacterales bacterium]